MTFRDAASAAQARAEALADALADKEAELEELRARLAEKDDALRGVEERAAPLLDADRDLKEIAARGERAEEEAARTKAEKERAQRERRLRQEERQRTERRRSSVSVWGDLRVLPLLPLAPIPLGLATAALANLFEIPVALPLLGLTSGGAVCLFGLTRFSVWRAESLWQREEAWARSHSHELVGYLELLQTELGGWKSRILTLEIQLRDHDGASELEAILKGFDVELTATNPSRWQSLRFPDTPKAEPPAGAVTLYRRLKRETSHNREFRLWVHRLHEEILTRLHARYGVTRVVFGTQED